MTHQHATSDTPRLGNLEAERAALSRMLAVSEGVFSLSIAICNSPTQRDEIIQDTRTSWPGVEVVSVRKSVVDLLGYAQDRIGRKEPSAVFIVDIEKVMPSERTDAKALRALNASRESWKKAFACPVVLWMPEYVATLVCTHAQDFWSWISHQFDFSAERAMEPAGAVSIGAPSLIENLTLREKELRIRELTERIGDVREGSDPQLKRHASRWLMELGVIYHLRGNYDRALHYYEQSLKTSEELGDRAGLATSLHNIGIIHHLRGDYDQALQYYEKSRETFEDLGDRAGVSSSLHQIGMVHHDRGDYEKALQFYEQSLKTAEELGDRAGVSTSLHQIGMSHQDRGDYEKALRCYEKSLKTLEELGDRAGVSRSLHQIGTVHQQRGDYDQALQYYEKSRKAKDELGDRAGISTSLHQIGMVYQHRGDYDQALHNYEESLKTSEELGDRPGVAKSRAQIGLLLIETKKYPEAFEHSFAALAIQADMAIPRLSSAPQNLARLRKAWGAENFDKAWGEKTGQDVPEGLKEQPGEAEMTDAGGV